MTRILLLLTICWSFAFSANAQDRRPDTSYYKSFGGSIIPRVFLSRNYSQLKFDPPCAIPTMHFHPNTSLNLGVGMAYKFVSFSISKGLGFLQSDSKKGRTKSLICKRISIAGNGSLMRSRNSIRVIGWRSPIWVGQAGRVIIYVRTCGCERWG